MMDIESHSISPKRDQEKFIFRLQDGLLISSIFVHYQLPDGGCRHVLSISSQVGCPMGCAFCQSGEMGFSRNLSTGEMLAQYFMVKDKSGLHVTHIDFGNMGEPLLNYGNVMDASRQMLGNAGMAKPDNIIITTSGVISGIERFVRDNLKYGLAISLNATTGYVRGKIMPVNCQYPISEILRAARLYNDKTGLKVTFKYMLIAGVNDSVDDAKRLKSMTIGIPCEVEIFPYVPYCSNRVPDTGFHAPSNDRFRAFVECLN